MKKVIIALGLLVMTVGNTAMATANGKEIDKHILQAFDKEFAGAVDVQWYINNNYVEVNFTFNSMHLVAYYNNDGETLAIVRNVYFSSLPLSLQRDLKKNYQNYWITKICEVSNTDGTQYRVTLENADKVVQLGSNGNYSWDIVKER